MCSVSQDDIQEHYDGPGGDTTFILSDTNAWEPDQLSLNPSKEPENSIVTSIPSTAPFNDQYTWAEDENNEGEDAGRDELYNFNPNTGVPASFTGEDAIEPPALVHESSSSSNPDFRSYIQNPETPPMPGAPTLPIKREDAASHETVEAQQIDENNKTLTYRERNRIAAHKCRQKTKQSVQELQQQERDLAEQNKFLNAHVDHLKEEVLGLKNQILNHGNCEDEIIQNYITESAKKLRSS